jgi:hypothetical protein
MPIDVADAWKATQTAHPAVAGGTIHLRAQAVIPDRLLGHTVADL